MIQRLHPGPRMSQAVVHGDTVYLAGQVADDPSVDVAGQTRQILRGSIACSPRRAPTRRGSCRRRSISRTSATFAQMNFAWDAWVPDGHTPARATVEAKLAAPQYKVEIQVIAAV